MKELVELLNNIKQGIDYEKIQDLVTGGYFESLDLLTVIAELEEHYKIEILPNEITPTNFDSAGAMLKLILTKKK